MPITIPSTNEEITANLEISLYKAAKKFSDNVKKLTMSFEP